MGARQLICTIVLFVPIATPRLALADGANDFEPGQTVIVVNDADLKVGGQPIKRVAIGQPLTISQIDRDSLWVCGDRGGWIESKYVASPADALALFGELIRGEPENARLYDARAMAYAAQGQRNLAIADHDQAIRLAPSPTHFAHRGATYLAQEDYEHAIADGDAALEIDSDSAPAFDLRGAARLGLRQYDLALADFDHALSLDPKFAPALVDRGRAYHQLAQYEKSISAFNDALELLPKCGALLGRRGEAQLAIDHGDRAVADFQQAIEFNPRLASAHYQLGRLALSRGAGKARPTELELALSLEPQNPLFANALALYFLPILDDRPRDGQKALDYATAACELSGRSVGAYLHTLAEAQAELGDFDAAIDTQLAALDVATISEEFSFELRLVDLRMHKRPFYGGIHFNQSANRAQLKFKIVAVAERQQPAANPPFHVGGGDWTFMECQAEDDADVRFTVGLTLDGFNGPWGRAVLAVPDQESGAKFVDLFGKSFSAKVPPAAGRNYRPKPFTFFSILLSPEAKFEPNNFHSDGELSMRWSPNLDAQHCLFQFKFDLDKRSGAFQPEDWPVDEKPDALTANWAVALRDGPPPPRQPDADKQGASAGPTIGPARKLLPRGSRNFQFSPGGRYAVYEDRGVISALPLDKVGAEPFEIARFDHAPEQWRLLNDQLEIITQESPQRHALDSFNPESVQIWWLSPLEHKKTLLRGPAKSLHLTIACVSPDMRFVTLFQSSDPLHYELVILDRETGGEKIVPLPHHSMSLERWRQTEQGLRGVLTSHWFGGFDGGHVDSYFVDPLAGTLERLEGQQARADFRELTSADGKYRFRVGRQDLTLTELASGIERRLLFDEDEQRMLGYRAVRWVSPRYLEFRGRQLTFIDAETLEMHRPSLMGGWLSDSHVYMFTPDFRWMMYESLEADGQPGEGLYLAPISVP